jgi:hypothetical protein
MGLKYYMVITSSRVVKVYNTSIRTPVLFKKWAKRHN